MIKGYSEEEQKLRDELIAQIESGITELSEILTNKDEEL
jgi:hypothetical protein